MTSNKWTFIDLFAGIGGFHLALKSFKGKCVFSSEWDNKAQKIYEDNFKTRPYGDITQINELDIPRHDVLCAGFPCQPFSISGKRLGFQDIRGTLFFDIARIVRVHKPKIVFLENVKNFMNHDNGKTLSVVIQTMNDLGYKVYYEIMKSSYYGPPQARERIYLVCFHKKLKINKEFTFPKKRNLRQNPVKCILENNVSAEFTINRSDIQIYKDEFDIKCPYSPHKIGIINKGGQGERIYSIHSVGITLSAYGGGVAAKTGAYLVNGKIRKLTPLECLRMQGFPDSFKLSSNKNDSYKQLGNAVSVPVIKKIFKEIESVKNLVYRKKKPLTEVKSYGQI